MTPLDETCEFNGIKLRMISAVKDQDTAVAYFKLQDLTNENRITEYMDFTIIDFLIPPS